MWPKDAKNKTRMTSQSFRRWAGFALLALLAAIVRAPDARAADALYRFAPAGGWVLGATPDYEAPAPAGETTGGSWLLALDRQVNVTTTGDDAYQYVAIKVLN